MDLTKNCVGYASAHTGNKHVCLSCAMRNRNALATPRCADPDPTRQKSTTEKIETETDNTRYKRSSCWLGRRRGQ